MKIRLCLLMLYLGVFSIASAQNEEKGWEEGVAALKAKMIPCDKKESSKVFVGNLSFSEVIADTDQLYSNNKKNIYLSVPKSSKKVTQLWLHPELASALKKDSNLKALIYDKKVQLVNPKGYIVKNASYMLVKIKD